MGSSDEKAKTNFKNQSTEPCMYVKQGYFWVINLNVKFLAIINQISLLIWNLAIYTIESSEIQMKLSGIC